jgi:hypothetical protein
MDWKNLENASIGLVPSKGRGRNLLDRYCTIQSCYRDGSVRWFFDHSIVSRIESKDFNFFSVELRLHLAYSESTQDFSTTYEDSIFQQG